MQVTTAFKRSWLRRIYRLVPATHATLTIALNSANDAAMAVAGASSGSVLSASANGRSTTLASPSAYSISSQDIAELCGDMLDRYDSARAALVTAGDSSPTDAEIYAQMLAELHAAFQSTPDFSNSRCFA